LALPRKAKSPGPASVSEASPRTVSEVAPRLVLGSAMAAISVEVNETCMAKGLLRTGACRNAKQKPRSGERGDGSGNGTVPLLFGARPGTLTAGAGAEDAGAAAGAAEAAAAPRPDDPC
jgi:hypothetical protein